MADFLFELGCEELPASAVRRAYEQLGSEVEKQLEQASLPHGAATVMGTPRRLILAISDIAERQEDVTKRQRGPSLTAAFDANGEPTGALKGFCKGQGVEVSELEREGDYVWVNKTIPGRSASEILSEIVPAAVRSLTFDKTMRWGLSRMRFSRPIRWMVALLGSDTLELEIEGVKAGRESRGHRFLAPDTFPVQDFKHLVDELRRRFVEPDASVREVNIRRQAEEVSGGRAQLSDALIEENVFLTEWPQCLLGDFPREYLELPRSVLITAMAKHEKMFPVQDEQGELSNQFVWVRNSGEEDTVRRGNQWVLNARFNDAKFFYDEDERFKLEDFLNRTAQMTFQEKLGSVRRRADRLAELAAHIAAEAGCTAEEIEWAREAGRFAKADLSSGLVGELASLQGIVGGDYARREGRPEPVCRAIAAQYDQNWAEEDSTTLVLIMADQIDKLVGFLGIGMPPTGSSDPYGLRRAATLLIEAAWTWPQIHGLETLFQKSYELYKDQGFNLNQEEIIRDLRVIFEQRYESLLTGKRYDVIEAALSPEALLNPRLIRTRSGVMDQIKDNGHLISTLSRPLNILAAAEKKGIEFRDGQAILQEDTETALKSSLGRSVEPLKTALDQEDASVAASILTSLADPINAFFDSTMVMVDDVAVRNARLQLMADTSALIRLTGDVTKLVPEQKD